MRRGLEPMARRLGLSPELAFFNPPTTSEARVLDAFRVGQSLLMTFTYPEGWPTAEGDEGRTPKLARRAAKLVHKALVTERGASAVSHMTQGYAHEMAELWRRAAESADDTVDPEQLRESAARSDALGKLAGEHWPVNDPFGAMELIALIERQRVTDMDNPDAMIDLRSYFGRVSVAFGAAAIALGGDLQEFAGFFYAPVAFLDLEVQVGLQHDWTYQGDIWGNLLIDDPRPYREMLQPQLPEELQGVQTVAAATSSQDEEIHEAWEGEDIDPSQLDRITRRALRKAKRI